MGSPHRTLVTRAGATACGRRDGGGTGAGRLAEGVGRWRVVEAHGCTASTTRREAQGRVTIRCPDPATMMAPPTPRSGSGTRPSPPSRGSRPERISTCRSPLAGRWTGVPAMNHGHLPVVVSSLRQPMLPAGLDGADRRSASTQQLAVRRANLRLAATVPGLSLRADARCSGSRCGWSMSPPSRPGAPPAASASSSWARTGATRP
jgi:hypothetical protein